MALSILSPLVEFILLGPVDDRRQLQDSPILGDVWIKFAKEPAARLDLLISPSMTKHAGAVADAIDNALAQDKADDPADIAYLQGLIAARLTFEEVLRVVVPKTRWWIGKWTKDPLPKVSERKAEGKARAQQPAHEPEFRHEVTRRYGGRQPAVDLTQLLTKMIHAAKDWNAQAPTPRRASDLVPLDRFAALAGLILWAGSQTQSLHENQPAKDLIKDILDRAEQQVGAIAAKLLHIADQMLDDESWKKKTEKGSVQVPLQKAEPLVFQVSLNRDALPALRQSVPAVKADAAKTLFKVNCSEIGWAVLDSGIDGNHPAFRTTVGDASRVKRSFDFRNFRKIVSLSNSKDKTRKENLEILMKDKDFLLQVSENPDGDLLTLAKDCRNRAPLHWELIERFVEIKPESPPATNHGTHVAGIIGANKKPALESAGLNDDNSTEVESIGFADGMCPDISLYDFRVLSWLSRPSFEQAAEEPATTNGFRNRECKISPASTMTFM